MTILKKRQVFHQIYTLLYNAFGPQHWWPGDTQFEIIIGAILTQNTNWGNVEKAIVNLKKEKVLHPNGLKDISSQKLSSLIKPAGYFNVKTKRLKNFIHFLFKEYNGSLKKMEKEPWADLRKELLSVNGIGPETADSILLYAFNKPIFVVDAYTKRFLYRHNFVDHETDYHAIQDLFMSSFVQLPELNGTELNGKQLPELNGTELNGKQLPELNKGDANKVGVFNEYHALIVRLGKDFCRPKPLCGECPLNNFHYSLTRKCPSC